MTDPAPAIVETAAAAPAKPAAPTPKAEQFTFYYSGSHRASYAPGRSISKFQGKEFTACCRAGEQPPPGKDVVKVGTGTLADVTTSKPE
jgi:hypothetical protein